MRRIFGVKKDGPPPPTLDDASKRMDTRVESVDGRIRQCDEELRRYRDQLKRAKGSAAVNIKKRAMATMKRKKMYENQRDQMASQAFNIEQTSFALDTAKDTLETVSAMKQASKTLASEYKKINIDQIEDLQDDLTDMMADMDEVQECLARSYNCPDDLDEADLEDELAALEDEWDQEGELEGEMPAYLQPASLPALPEPSQPAALPAVPVAAEAQGVDEFGLPMAPQAQQS